MVGIKVIRHFQILMAKSAGTRNSHPHPHAWWILSPGLQNDIVPHLKIQRNVRTVKIKYSDTSAAPASILLLLFFLPDLCSVKVFAATYGKHLANYLAHVQAMCMISARTEKHSGPHIQRLQPSTWNADGKVKHGLPLKFSPHLKHETGLSLRVLKVQSMWFLSLWLKMFQRWQRWTWCHRLREILRC